MCGCTWKCTTKLSWVLPMTLSGEWLCGISEWPRRLKFGANMHKTTLNIMSPCYGLVLIILYERAPPGFLLMLNVLTNAGFSHILSHIGLRALPPVFQQYYTFVWIISCSWYVSFLFFLFSNNNNNNYNQTTCMENNNRTTRTTTTNAHHHHHHWERGSRPTQETSSRYFFLAIFLHILMIILILSRVHVIWQHEGWQTILVQ